MPAAHEGMDHRRGEEEQRTAALSLIETNTDCNMDQ